MPNNNRPMTDPAQIQMGADYRDVVTGFVGTAVAHTRYITGCDRVSLQPALKPDELSKIPEWQTFDFTMLMLDPEQNPLLEAIREQVNGSAETARDNGGPRPEVQARPTPASRA